MSDRMKLGVVALSHKIREAWLSMVEHQHLY
jgi:hypothetical protein